MITAFITNRKSPNVNKVTGSVKSTIKGLTNKFSRPKTNATIMEVPKPATATPLSTLERKSTITAVVKIFKSNFIKGKVFQHHFSVVFGQSYRNLI